MSSTTPVPVFLLGVGLIGGSLLTTLRASTAPVYHITVLTRNPSQAEKLKKLGVSPLVATLDDHDLIVKATTEAQIIIHTATADHEPSVKAILEGLKPSNRRPNSPAPVYLHTSGTGLLTTDYEGSTPPKKIFSDLDPASIDALPDSAPHRNVDLLIKQAVDEGLAGEARVGIILPPLIYGIGTGPFNRISIQVPGWIRESLAAKKVSIVGTGVGEWNNIHVANLIKAYTVIISSLSSLPASPAPALYWFAEESHHTWLDLGKAIHAALLKKNLVEDSLEFGAPAAYMGSNSRSKADRIRALGWKPDASNGLSVFDSVESELEEILKE